MPHRGKDRSLARSRRRREDGGRARSLTRIAKIDSRDRAHPEAFSRSRLSLSIHRPRPRRDFVCDPRAIASCATASIRIRMSPRIPPFIPPPAPPPPPSGPLCPFPVPSSFPFILFHRLLLSVLLASLIFAPSPSLSLSLSLSLSPRPFAPRTFGHRVVRHSYGSPRWFLLNPLVLYSNCSDGFRLPPCSFVRSFYLSLVHRRSLV